MKNPTLSVSLRAVSAAVLLAAGALLAPNLAFAQATKVNVCHVTGNGGLKLLNIGNKALAAHLAHGDATPGSIIDGYLVGDDCSLTPVQVVNSVRLNFSSTGWAGWSCPSGTTVISCDVGGASVASKTLWVPGASVLNGAVNYPNTPMGYTYTPPETGCIVQNDGTPKTIVIQLMCAVQ